MSLSWIGGPSSINKLCRFVLCASCIEPHLVQVRVSKESSSLFQGDAFNIVQLFQVRHHETIE